MTGLKRSLGVPMLTFYGLGMILGAGIYSIIGKAAGVTGDGLWMAFVFAAIAALLTGYSYAELATMFPKAGAEFVFLSQAFKKQKWVGETAGIAMAFSGAASAATVAIAFTGYLNKFVEVPGLLISAGLLVVFTGIALIGVRASGWANIVFTLIEVFGLLLIIYLGMKSEKFGEALAVAPHAGILSGAALIVFSFFGFEHIVNLAEETREPEKRIPKAIFLSLAVSTILYVLVSLAAVALLSPSELASSDAALMAAAEGHSVGIAKILGAIALFATANTALISMVGASRILYGMAGDKSLPAVVGRVLPKRGTPWIASLLILAVALILLPLGEIHIVAGISSFATMLAFLSVNVALIRLRKIDPDRERSFRVPLSLGNVPVPAILATVCCVLFLFQFEATTYWVGGGFLLGCGLFFLARSLAK